MIIFLKIFYYYIDRQKNKTNMWTNDYLMNIIMIKWRGGAAIVKHKVNSKRT
jgi:hypothetical protein